MKKFALAASLALFASLAAHAQSTTPNLDQRQASQQQRIDQGVQSGQLNTQEAARLEQGQARVQRLEDKAKADGVVTKKERARLHAATDVESRRVTRQKHDRQRN